MINALIILGQGILVLRFILCAIRERDAEDSESQNYKKQKKRTLIAIILIACVYDIPKVIERYF
jgi:hypothetical protein